MALERVLGPVLGPRRDDLRAAQIVAALTSNGKKSVDLDDIALRFEKPVEWF